MAWNLSMECSSIIVSDTCHNLQGRICSLRPATLMKMRKFQASRRLASMYIYIVMFSSLYNGIVSNSLKGRTLSIATTMV